LAGIIQIALGVVKVGQYIRYIPYPVVSGFMTGIGVIIIITQIMPLIGYYPKEDTEFVNTHLAHAEEQILERILQEEAAEEILVLEDFEETVRRADDISKEDIMREARVLAAADASGVMGSIRLFPRAMSSINWIDVVLGLLTIIIIYGFKKITTAIPCALVALVGVTLGAYFLLPEYRTIGTIRSGFPELHLELFYGFSFGDIKPFIVTAISLAVLGAMDSLLTSIVADNKTKTKHNPDRELVGQGIGNSIAALFGGIPGAGATIRTVVNIEAGGMTRLSGMIAGILLLTVLLALGPLASVIPAAVLAGILVTVGIGVMDYKGIKHFRQLPKSEATVMVLVILLTVFVGLIEAVVVGLVLASVLFMKIIADVISHRTKSEPLRDFSREMPWSDERDIISRYGSRVYIKHLDGPLFFGFASRFQDMVQALPDIEYVVIRMDKVPYVDQSGLYAMEDAVLDLHAQGITVLFIDIHGQPLELFKMFDLIPDLIDEERCFPDFKTCYEWLLDHLTKKDNGS
jgi:SulP family sulfate permease